MFIVQIAALLIIIMGIAWKYRERAVDTIPVAVSLLVLVLYMLSFFNALSFSDLLALLVLAGAVVFLVRISGEKRGEVLGYVREQLVSPGFLTAAVMTVVVVFCVRDKVTVWWDDYNFWATDVKSIFYLDGFAAKYANVAPEFGDYPPATQMMKWWFLHFSPELFHEGLMFAGYHVMNLAFLFPLLGFIRKRNALQMAVGAAVLWLFPGVAEAFWFDGSCADLTMAVIYGAFLMSVADREGHDPVFYYGRQGLFLMVLSLCKNTGFLWVAFGLLFDYGYHIMMRKITVSQPDLWKNNRGLAAVTVMPVLSFGSWMVFCLINRRVAKLTGTALRMASGSLSLPDYQGEMTSAFVEAFWRWPLHRGKTFAIDLTPLALYLLLILFVFLLYRVHSLTKRTAAFVGVFFAVTGIVFYGFNLLSHLTIFAIEAQYLEPFGMISSIERYGAPFTIGGLYLLDYFAMRGLRAGRGLLVCAVFVLLTTDYAGAYRALIGHGMTREETLAGRQEVLDANAMDFLEIVGSAGVSGRVLSLRDASDISWVRNTYISFEAAPVSVLYGSVDGENMESGDILRQIEESHAKYLYVDELSEKGKGLLAPFLKEGELAYGCLYVVESGEKGIELVRY